MNYVLIGAAGYVAKKHMEAISNVGGNLIAILDPHDSVGIIDSYFPKCKLFTEFERFDRFCSKHKDNGNTINYVSICSPNYLHDAHCRFAMRIGADAICEKPLTLRERNLDDLKLIEKLTGHKIYTILQLRLNPILIDIRKKIWDWTLIPDTADLVYHTPRGNWYDYSWKANKEKSGGLVTNIGIHLFDMLCWLFGQHSKPVISYYDDHNIKGSICFHQHCDVSFDLSISQKNKALRSLRINNEKYELSNKFTALHTESYMKILDRKGFGLEDARPAITLCESLRNQMLK
jgi:UDP-N-acetyl-2-amino-2-deoxyglucuronate dehydrogenase